MTIHQLHPRGQPFTWQERLDAATAEADVVDVVRDYLATLSPQEFAYLPENLRPGKIVDANDITTYAFELVRYECQDDGAQRLVQRLANVLSRASIRLSEIMVTQHNPNAGRRSGDHSQRSA